MLAGPVIVADVPGDVDGQRIRHGTARLLRSGQGPIVVATAAARFEPAGEPITWDTQGLEAPT